MFEHSKSTAKEQLSILVSKLSEEEACKVLLIYEDHVREQGQRLNRAVEPSLNQ